MIDAATSQSPALFFIPSLLGDTAIDRSIPAATHLTVSSLTYFLVEDEKAARAFIKALCPQLQIRDLSISKIPENPTAADIELLMSPLTAGHSIGVISDAGCPGIADPGAALATYAHAHQIRVVPLVGPCSMVLALMASGLNGQAWRFVGYLPIDTQQRAAEIRALDDLAHTSGETQIMMDTPYRNEKLLHDILTTCRPTTRLCIAQALTTAAEYISTRPISSWRSTPPQLSKAPCLFLIGRN